MARLEDPSIKERKWIFHYYFESSNPLFLLSLSHAPHFLSHLSPFNFEDYQPFGINSVF